MPAVRDSSKIREFGSEIANFRVSDASGSYTGALLELPLTEDQSFSDTTDQSTRTDAGGNNYNIDGARTRTFSGNFMQTDPDTLELLSETHRGQRLCIVQELNKDDQTYLVMPAAKVDPSFEFSTPGGQVPFSFTVEPLSASVDIAMADFAHADFSSSLSGTLTVGTKGYAIYTQA